jgi:hypothetical protein
VEIEHVDRLTSPSGKHRYVVSKVAERQLEVLLGPR